VTQIVFDFKDLITHCLHDKEIRFTNAISLEVDSRVFISKLFQNLKSICQEVELEELFQRDHFHFVKSSYTKDKIEKLINDKYLETTRLCQIPLSQEFRLYGNLKKVKHTNLYLFKALLLDPNHLIYHHEKNFKKLKNLTCLFSETNCSQ
jgi:hypothetical protein